MEIPKTFMRCFYLRWNKSRTEIIWIYFHQLPGMEDDLIFLMNSNIILLAGGDCKQGILVIIFFLIHVYSGWKRLKRMGLLSSSKERYQVLSNRHQHFLN